MKNLSLTATIYIVLSLLFVIGNFTAVMAAPDRIWNPGFETPGTPPSIANWTYSEVDDNDFDGAQAADPPGWVSQGTYSYLFSIANKNIGNAAYCQILQSSVDFSLIDRFSFDAYLEADTSLEFEAEVWAGGTKVWSKAVPNITTEYLHEIVDVSGIATTGDLIFRIQDLLGAKAATINCYFDNIKIWGSHSDATWTTVENSFAGATNHAYMYGENFDAGTTKVGWYDGSGDWMQTDTELAWGGGILNWSECYFMDFIGAAAAGDWHAVVLLQADAPPATYAAAIADPDFIADDVFNVDASAIPEFPEVMAAIGVAGLCFGIYYWMRKRARRVHGVT